MPASQWASAHARWNFTENTTSHCLSGYFIQTLLFSSGNPIHKRGAKKRNLRYAIGVFVHRSQT
jgi:hypothetical protein